MGNAIHVIFMLFVLVICMGHHSKNMLPHRQTFDSMTFIIDVLPIHKALQLVQGG